MAIETARDAAGNTEEFHALENDRRAYVEGDAYDDDPAADAETLDRPPNSFARGVVWLRGINAVRNGPTSRRRAPNGVFLS